MVYGKVTRAQPPTYNEYSSPSDAMVPGAAEDQASLDVEAASDPNRQHFNSMQPPKNVSSAYEGGGHNPLDPMACFKQTSQCIQQQHYLDPKYHGAGSTLAHIIQEKTGDEAMTKRILTTICVAVITSVALILFFVVISDFEGPAAEPVAIPGNNEPGPEFAEEDVASLLQNPGRRSSLFNHKYGDDAAANVLATVLKKRFNPNDLKQLLREPKKFSPKFNAKYGRGKAEDILDGPKDRTEYKHGVTKKKPHKKVQTKLQKKHQSVKKKVRETSGKRAHKKRKNIQQLGAEAEKRIQEDNELDRPLQN